VTQPETRTGLVTAAGGEPAGLKYHTSSLKQDCSYEEDHVRAEDSLTPVRKLQCRLYHLSKKYRLPQSPGEKGTPPPHPSHPVQCLLRPR